MLLMEETMSMKRTISTLALALGLLAGAAVIGLNAACFVFDENGLHFLGGPEYKEDFLKTVPLSAGGSFSLKNTNGVVRLSTWAKDEVEIKAVKTARGERRTWTRSRSRSLPRPDPSGSRPFIPSSAIFG